jgi:hypothetical protein
MNSQNTSSLKDKLTTPFNPTLLKIKEKKRKYDNSNRWTK